MAEGWAKVSKKLSQSELRKNAKASESKWWLMESNYEKEMNKRNEKIPYEKEMNKRNEKIPDPRNCFWGGEGTGGPQH